MRVIVPPDLGGKRCDLVLARIGGFSRATARALVEAGVVRVDGVVVDSLRQEVAAGAVVEFESLAEDPGLQPAAVAFGVLYEDAHLAVIDKPAGVVTHPGAGDTGATLAAGVLHRWPSVRGVGAENRWGIVHRLDRDTSGVLVVALDEAAERGLRESIRAHRVVREYLALVHGAPATPTGTIDAPLGRDPARPTRMRIDPAGRPAVTHYRIEQGFGALTLLRVTLETGRTHQIRVHLAGVGMAVAGDRTYGRAGATPRTFLHAARLSFDHPVTGVLVDVSSPLPADLAAVLATLSAGDNADA